MQLSCKSLVDAIMLTGPKMKQPGVISSPFFFKIICQQKTLISTNEKWGTEVIIKSSAGLSLRNCKIFLNLSV
jgi:hypothetical protein